MLKCYLWLALCLQFALINAVKTRRGSLSSGGILKKSADAQEHIHIKVHISDAGRSHTRPSAVAHHRLNSYHHKANSLPQRYNKNVFAPTLPTSSKELPYEFDTFGLGGGDDENSLITTSDMFHNSKHGPVLFTSNIQSGSTQQPMSQQLMRQIFSPEMMEALKTETDENNLAYMADEQPAALDENDMMHEYFDKFNQPRAERLTAINIGSIDNNWSPKLTHTRKKYGSTGIGEAYHKESLQQQFYNTILKEQQREALSTSKARKNTQRNQRQQQQKQRQGGGQQINFKPFQPQTFEDDTSTSFAYSGESEVDNIDATTSTGSAAASTNSASVEDDMTAAFNRLKPISYHDMYGEYATPITTASKSSSPTGVTGNKNNKHYQPKGLSFYQETIPTYTRAITTPLTVNDWLQQYQRPEQQQQHHQHSNYDKPHHQQQQQQKKHKPKSQQTQFVLPATTLRLASSPSLSSLSSLSSSSPTTASSLSTSPISSGFGSGLSSSAGSTWSMPYDFVQQSYQQQLAAQQQPQQQQLQTLQQHYKPNSLKKRKNRTKRKRNRIIVE